MGRSALADSHGQLDVVGEQRRQIRRLRERARGRIVGASRRDPISYSGAVSAPRRRPHRHGLGPAELDHSVLGRMLSGRLCLVLGSALRKTLASAQKTPRFPGWSSPTASPVGESMTRALTARTATMATSLTWFCVGRHRARPGTALGSGGGARCAGGNPGCGVIGLVIRVHLQHIMEKCHEAH